MMRLAIVGVLMALPAVVCGQDLGRLDGSAVKSKSYVMYVAEGQNIAAGRRSVLEMNFRVADGFHVNSHPPKSELLIPTQIALQPANGVKLAAVEYPEGTSYSLTTDPTEKLDVYTGTFTIRLPVTATAGEHTVNGTLRYQACDRAACYPPKNLPVQVIFTAK